MNFLWNQLFFPQICLWRSHEIWLSFLHPTRSPGERKLNILEQFSKQLEVGLLQSIKTKVSHLNLEKNFTTYSLICDTLQHERQNIPDARQKCNIQDRKWEMRDKRWWLKQRHFNRYLESAYEVNNNYCCLFESHCFFCNVHFWCQV